MIPFLVAGVGIVIVVVALAASKRRAAGKTIAGAGRAKGKTPGTSPADRSAGAPDGTLEKAAAQLEENIALLSRKERDLLERIRNLEAEIDPLRQERIKEMESVVTARKEAALNRVTAWAEEEKARLGQQFNAEYEAQTAALRQEVTAKIHEEFDQIHAFFEDFAKSRKSDLDEDIKKFLESRRTAIIERLE